MNPVRIILTVVLVALPAYQIYRLVNIRSVQGGPTVESIATDTWTEASYSRGIPNETYHVSYTFEADGKKYEGQARLPEAEYERIETHMNFNRYLSTSSIMGTRSNSFPPMKPVQTTLAVQHEPGHPERNLPSATISNERTGAIILLLVFLAIDVMALVGVVGGYLKDRSRLPPDPEPNR